MVEEETINLKDYIQVLRRRKYIILLVFIVCLPVIFIKAYSGVPVYSASAKLLIQENNVFPLLTESGFRYNPNFLATQTQIIKSSKVAESIVMDLNLDETYRQYFPDETTKPSFIYAVKSWFRNIYVMGLKLAGLIKNPSEFQQIDETPPTEAEIKNNKVKSIAAMISGGIFVSSGSGEGSDQGNIVDVGFMSPNPVFAQKIVNSIASAYKRVLLEITTQSTAETIEWMKTKADSQLKRLEASEKRLQEYKKKNDIYTVGNEEALFPGKIAELSRKLTQTQAEVNEIESLYHEISRISPQEALNLPTVADNEIIQNLRQKIINQEQELDGLSKKIGPKHPQMIRATRDLASLNEKLEKEIHNVIQSIKNKYDLAKGQANSIQRLLDETKRGAATMSDKLIQYEILKREVDVNRLLYERLISRVKESDVAENKQTIDVWVVEEAQIPFFPASHGPKRTLLMGLIASLMAGIGLAFFLEYIDNTIKTAEDAEARLNIPILGMVPFFKDKDHEIDKIAHQLPHSSISENYKVIRTALLLSASNVCNTLLITSMAQKAGKTVTATNLAISLAQAQRRVLLVDADMRRPRVHKTFEMDNTNGLSTYLAGAPDVAARNADESTFLHILPSGPPPTNPSELLSSTRLNELIQQFQTTYDFIIFDSPPMADVTDAVLISKVVDNTILVGRSGVSTYQALEQAGKVFKNINANVLGLIVNAVDEKKHNYYHYKYYGTSGSYYVDGDHASS
jgi:capsular exopolysaccharide synthesis family protein